MKIGLTSDHAAIELRAHLMCWLEERGYTVIESGPITGESVDYPDMARPLAQQVAAGELDRAVLLCGTGQGVGMAANKVPGVRAAIVADPYSARMAMAHNDARILCMGARVIGAGVAESCLEAWLGATFEGGRHARRVGKIEP